jgi:hypothetical protein
MGASLSLMRKAFLLTPKSANVRRNAERPEYRHMALPAHLAKYDSLIDLVADAIVRELLAGESPNEKPAAPGRALPRVKDLHDEDTTSERSAKA